MRALLKEKDDQTIFAVEVVDMGYDKEAKELYVTTQAHFYVISRIVEANARSAAQELYDTGKVDLTAYDAEIEDD